MNASSLTLASAFLRERPVMAMWAAAQMALAVALLTAQMLVAKQAGDRLAEAAQSGVDWVVGAPLTPTGAVLAGVFFDDRPSDGFPYGDVADLSESPAVGVALPIARADNFEGWPIIGANRAYLQHFGVRLVEGSYWSAPMQAVIGADVSENSELGIGDRFQPSRGLRPGGEDLEGIWYEVVGVFEPSDTVADRAIATSLESVWQAHEVPPERGRINAMLLQQADPATAEALAEQVQMLSGVSAIGPLSTPRTARTALYADLPYQGGVGSLVLALAVASVFVAVVALTGDRRRLVALARVMGAHERRLIEAVLLEGAAIGAIGAVAGVALAHIMVGGVALFSAEMRALGVTGFEFLLREVFVMLTAVAIGVAAAAGPAFIAARVSIAKALAS